MPIVGSGPDTRSIAKRCIRLRRHETHACGSDPPLCRNRDARAKYSRGLYRRVQTWYADVRAAVAIVLLVNERRLDPATRYLLTPHVLPDWYGREMELLATGTGYRWLSDLFGWTDGTLDQCACNSPPGARGLTLEHTANDIARGAPSPD